MRAEALKYVKERRDFKNKARYRQETKAKAEPSVSTKVQKVDAAIDESGIILAVTAGHTIQAHLTKAGTSEANRRGSRRGRR